LWSDERGSDLDLPYLRGLCFGVSALVVAIRRVKIAEVCLEYKCLNQSLAEVEWLSSRA
jgi:hypothetical protein